MVPLGSKLCGMNELDEAITAFERARALAPRQADTYFNLGLVYWKKGNVSKAKESYRAGLGTPPEGNELLCRIIACF